MLLKMSVLFTLNLKQRKKQTLFNGLLCRTTWVSWHHKGNKNSAVAEMGDRLATTDMGRKVGTGCCGGPHLT